jgi:pyridoxamine 5'-phosphate oxidase
MPDTQNIIPETPSTKAYKSEGEKETVWTAFNDPVQLFKNWLAQAGETEINDPNAMSLATVDADGLPDVRILLLKGFDEKGFVFYSNSQSAKGAQLELGKAALCFHWKSQKRQVRVRGTLSQVTEQEADAYFAKRARGSRIGAWASDQSRPVAGREVMMEKVAEVEARYEGQEVPRPPHWKGWRLNPQYIEFWQDGAFRLHDRIVFQKSSDDWMKLRLYP